ncbi:MAG TPA: hypothetical protein VFG84_03120 [Gemmatimonadaceae bacterium]|nr:hypothetical protein [Gemmatimonadaceae bacterium]
MRWRLFLTVWIVYALHATTNVVRETYLALALAEHGSVRVDEYLGLHPDLFEIPGRGSYINSNPGASIVGAIPLFVARPAMAVLFRLKPDLVAPKPSATYDDPRPNRTEFMNEARARGLDIKLGLAALVTQVGLMGPMGALATLVVFAWFSARIPGRRTALGLALLFAFGTPTFFRAAFLNHNALLAHYTLFAFVLLAGMRPRRDGELPAFTAVAGSGALLGLGLLTDYSAAPLLLVFGVWVLGIGYRRAMGDAQRSGDGERARGIVGAIREGAWFTAAAAVPIVMLLVYQWWAFGDPWFPAQRYMPPTEFSVRGWFGFTVPTLDLLVRNLADPAYGLFTFAPVLLAAAVAPFLRADARFPSRSQQAVIWSASGALLVFASANQFSHLQWNTGIRYMMPAVPLLFLLAAPALLRMPVWGRWSLIVATVTVSWVVSMTREAIPRALTQVFVGGFELPTLTVLHRMASGYAPWLEGDVSPLPLFVLTGVVLWLIWRDVKFDSAVD